MTKEQLERANKLTKQISTLEEGINKVTKSVFNGETRNEVVSDRLTCTDWLGNDLITLLTNEECQQINQTIYDIICNKIKIKQEELEKI